MTTNNETSRRDFLQTALGVAATAGLAADSPAQTIAATPLKVSVFSKHLHWLDWEPMARMAKELGFDGVDLTVRKGGHIEPERAEQELPKVADIIRKTGLELPMITAGIVDARTPHAEAILRAMKSAGIERYRWGNLKYKDGQPIPQQLEALKGEVAKLADLNRKYDVTAMYHTHSGAEIGAPIWDLWLILKDQDTTRVGVNYDLCHATIEGGLGAWVRSAQLVAPMMHGIAIKDFRWARNAKGDWVTQKCPLGEGMVNFKRFFPMLKAAKFSGPVQMHFEYPLGGADSGAKTLSVEKAKVIEAMRKDLETLRGWLREAQLV